MPRLLRKSRTGIAGLLVVFDTLDLPPGRCRLKLNGSSAGHRGLSSIIETLSTDRFMRLSIGVGRPSGAETVVDHVLGDLSDSEALATEATILRCLPAVLALTETDPAVVMNDINRRD